MNKINTLKESGFGIYTRIGNLFKKRIFALVFGNQFIFAKMNLLKWKILEKL